MDGSTGEGGGQVVRSLLTLSVLSGRAVEIQNIRAGRPKPGLRPQHLAAVHAAAAICGASVEGAKLESQELCFVPGESTRAGSYVFDVAEIAGRGSAGSAGLVLQTVLLPLALAEGPSSVLLRGGTHVPWAPSADYLEAVFLPAITRLGLRVEMELTAWGFYPAGGGEIRVQIEGAARPLKPLDLTERGNVLRVWGRGVAANLPSHISQRMVDRARSLLEAEGLRTAVEAKRVRSAGPGAAIFLFAEYERGTAGFSAYGRKGLAAERVAAAACDDLLAHHRVGAPVDPWLADQLILPLAMASGTSRVRTTRITRHLTTSLALLQAFLPVVVQVEGEEGRPGEIRITGTGSVDD